MSAHLCMLLLNPRPEQPELCGAPFFHAAAAAAMDIEVEMYFVGPAVQLLKRGVAQQLYPGGERSVYEFLRHAVEFGVKLYACPGAMQAHGLSREQLVDEVSGIAGAATYLGRVMDPAWKNITY